MARVTKRRERSGLRNTGMAIARSYPDILREKIAPLIDKWVARVEEALDEKTRTLAGEKGVTEVNNPVHRTAMDLLPKVLGAMGADNDLIERLLDRLNARDEATLGIAMGMYHAASSATLEDSERVAVQTIRGIVKASPWKRARLREACFGEREIEQGITPVLTNGHHQEGRENGTVPRA